MKKVLFLFLGCLLIQFTGCQKSGNQTWEDVKTAGRYMNKSINTLCGKYTESQLLCNEDEFIGPEDVEFIPLNDSELGAQYTIADKGVPQPKYSCGETGSGLPAMEKFSEPKGQLGSLFRTLHFETDDHVIRNHQDLVSIQQIAAYIKKHPKVFLNIEGHCDERASAGYNMALGTRRANHLRVLLIKQGVDYNRIYTVSHGKEKPIAKGHGEKDWKLNRRVEFKIYEKQ